MALTRIPDLTDLPSTFINYHVKRRENCPGKVETVEGEYVQGEISESRWRDGVTA